VIICGAVALIGALTVSYQLGAELLNFGAFLAFLGVNASAFHHYWLKGSDRSWSQGLPPILGGAICFYIWLSLRPQAKVVGFTWMAIGLAYYFVRRFSRAASSSPSTGQY